MREMEHLEECGICHSLHPMEELAAFDDTLVCPECMEDTTAVYGRCGERIWIEDDAGIRPAGGHRGGRGHQPLRQKYP